MTDWAGASRPFDWQKTLWPAVVALGGIIALFELTNLDLWVQDFCFDFATGQWVVEARARLPRVLFYLGPKVVIILIGLTALVLAGGPTRWRQARRLERRSLWVVFLTIGLVPAVIGQIKASTNVYCPYEVVRYGGTVPYVRVLERHPPELQPERCGRCWPGGHASGGFALLALAGLGVTRRSQLLGVAVGLSVGWGMGGYQTLKGAHYLSHSFVTMMIAWIGFLLIQRLVGVPRPPTRTPEAAGNQGGLL